MRCRLSAAPISLTLQWPVTVYIFVLSWVAHIHIYLQFGLRRVRVQPYGFIFIYGAYVRIRSARNATGRHFGT